MGIAKSKSLTDLLTTAEPDLALRDKIRDLTSKLMTQPPDYCLQCSKCTSGCEVMMLLENKPHEVVSLVRLGFVDELIKSDRIWHCTLCLKCRERCPQRVAPVDVFIALRNIAVSSGLQVPEGYSRMLSSILEVGFVQTPQKVVGPDFTTYTREGLGLKSPSKPVDINKFQSILFKVLQEGV